MSTESGEVGAGKEQKQSKRTQFPFWSFILCEAGLSLFWALAMWWNGNAAWAKPEALGALFSGWAFVAMFFALRIQSEELSLQREELEATREELRRTAAASEKTVELETKNVRAQYLMFWIERHTKEYEEAKANIPRFEKLLNYGKKALDTIWSPESKQDATNKLAQYRGQINKDSKLISRYKCRESELDNLTQELLTPMPPVHFKGKGGLRGQLTVGTPPEASPPSPDA